MVWHSVQEEIRSQVKFNNDVSLQIRNAVQLDDTWQKKLSDDTKMLRHRFVGT